MRKKYFFYEKKHPNFLNVSGTKLQSTKISFKELDQDGDLLMKLESFQDPFIQKTAIHKNFRQDVSFQSFLYQENSKKLLEGMKREQIKQNPCQNFSTYCMEKNSIRNNSEKTILALDDPSSIKFLDHSLNNGSVNFKKKMCEQGKIYENHNSSNAGLVCQNQSVYKKHALMLGLIICLNFFSGCDQIGKSKKAPLKGKRISLYQTEETQREKIHFSVDNIQVSATQVTQWAQPGLNPPHHMGSLALDGDASLSLAPMWEKSVSKEVVLPVVPIATPDRIFIVDHRGFLSAMDWSGKLLWSVQVNYESDCYGMGGGLATDGHRVYVTTPHRWVLALDYNTGKVLWSYALSHPVRNGPCLSNNRLAVLTLANQTILLDACTGKEIWDDQGLREDTLVLGGSVPAITKDRVIVGTASGEVIALSLTQGERLWDRPLASLQSIEGEKNFRHIHAYPVVVGDRVYATSDSGQMVCFDLYSGDIIWSQDGIGGMQTPIVVGNTVLTISTAGRCVAVDKQSGKEFWEVSLPQNEKWFGPVMAGGLLHLLSENGHLVVLDPVKKGKCVYTMSLKGHYTMAPIVMNGGLLFLSNKGILSFYKRQKLDLNPLKK